MPIRLVPAILATQMLGLVARGDGISIYPTTILLDPDNKVGTVTILNRGDSDASYELAGYRWSQSNDEDVLTHDRAFVVTPPVVSLRAGEERMVRVGLLSAPETGNTEQAYRLRISELPDDDGVGGANLNVRLQVLLPVFEARPGVSGQIGFNAHRNTQGNICIEGDNQGDAHVKLVWIADADKPDQKMPVQKYVLAGSRGTLCMDETFDAARSVTVGVTSARQRDVEPYEIPITAP